MINQNCLSTIDIDLSTEKGYESVTLLCHDYKNCTNTIIHMIELEEFGIMIEHSYEVKSDSRQNRQVTHHNSKIIHIDMESDIHAKYDKKGKLRCKHKNKQRMPKRLYADFDAYKNNELDMILDLLYL